MTVDKTQAGYPISIPGSRPVCLPANPSQEQYMSKESVIAGWGYFDVTQESPETSKVLRDTEVRVQSHDTCLNTRGAYRWDGRKHVVRYGYSPSQYQPSINICTAGRTEVWHGPRPGDSGSALMMEENGRSSKIFPILWCIVYSSKQTFMITKKARRQRMAG